MKKEIKLIEIAPDGPQGGKIKLGITSDNQLSQLKKGVEKLGGGHNLPNIIKVATELNIPRMDT